MPYLVHELDNGEQQVIPLLEGINTIGRHPSNQLVNDHKSLSRYHAQLIVHGNELLITDNHSRNGTFVNHQPIQQSVLHDGDTVQCGDILYKLTFQDPTPQPPENELEILTRIQLDWPESSLHDILQPKDGVRVQALATELRLESPFPLDSQQNVLNKLQILLEVSRELSSLQDPSQLLDRSLDLLFSILEIDRAAILLINAKTGELEQQAAKCSKRRASSKRFYSQRIVEFVQQTGDAIISRDAQTDRRFDDADSIVNQSIRASMCVPLKTKQKVIGVLYVDSLSLLDVYKESDLQFLTALASQAAIAIENTNLSRKLAEAAVLRSRMERFFPPSVLHKMEEADEALLEIVDTEVSALFVDISDFTQMSSTMEPRQVIGMLNEYFTVMVEEIVFPYAGTLEKYIGDALLAIWGAPYQIPDDADRAVYAAITMQHRIQALNESWAKSRDLAIQIHIGINSGKVAAGNIGSPRLIQYATIGDTTNVASRICNVANAGEIVISSETLNRLNNRQIPVVPLPPTNVKGKDKPLYLFKLLWREMKVPPVPKL